MGEHARSAWNAHLLTFPQSLASKSGSSTLRTGSEGQGIHVESNAWPGEHLELFHHQAEASKPSRTSQVMMLLGVGRPKSLDPRPACGCAGEARGAQLAVLAEADRDTSPQTALFYQQAVSAVPVLLIGFIFREGNTLVSKLSVQTLRAAAGSGHEHQVCLIQRL